MKRLFARLFNQKPSVEERPAAPTSAYDAATTADAPGVVAACGPTVGSVYSFRTKPYTPFSPAATQRYAAIKVIGADGKVIAIGVLDGIWPAPPTLFDARAAAILTEHRFSNTGDPAVFGVFPEWWTPETDFDALEFVGVQPLTSNEQEMAAVVIGGAVGVSYSTLHSADFSAEGEWRWAHDRDAFVRENDQRFAAQAAAGGA